MARTAAQIIAALERERREVEWHVANHPSERWEAKLETIDLMLGYAKGEA